MKHNCFVNFVAVGKKTAADCVFNNTRRMTLPCGVNIPITKHAWQSITIIDIFLVCASKNIIQIDI
jgi:hypothetical protein